MPTPTPSLFKTPAAATPAQKKDEEVTEKEKVETTKEKSITDDLLNL